MFGHDAPQITIFNLDAEQGEHWHHLFRELAIIKEGQMAVTQQVQSALDGIRQTKSLVKSVEDGMAVQKQMISDQGKQIADLQAQIAAGATIGADDLGALAETNQDILDVNTSLTNDIPANTTPPAGAAPAPAPAPAAASGAVPAPLAGTGSI